MVYKLEPSAISAHAGVRNIILMVLTLFICQPALSQSDMSGSVLQSVVNELGGKNKNIQMQAIDTIAASGDERRSHWFSALLAGDLYVRKSDQRIVMAVKEGKNYVLSDSDTGRQIETVSKRAITKIRINNAIRIKLKGILGTLELENPDAQKRLIAVNQLVGKVDAEGAQRIRALAAEESNDDVKESMQLLIAISDLTQGTPAQTQQALNYSKGNLNNDLINALRVLSVSTTDSKIASQAQLLMDDALRIRAWYAKIETLFFGIFLGSVLVIAAIGLAITFGVMGVINMAHGELIMLGAYTTYFVQQLLPNAINYSLLLALPAAFLVSGFVGILIERGVIRHLYGRPLETLLATVGISLMLQQLVRTFVSSQNVAVINPSWMSGSLVVNPALSLTLNRLIIIGFCLVVFALLLLLFSRSGFGLQMRAVAQNRQMARAMGIRSSRVDVLTFGLGSGIAGIAGVALSQLGNVGPNLGQSYIIDSFMVVVFGGVGSLWGTLVAGMSVGIGNKLLEPWAGAVMAKILILVFIILFIQRKPRGLFPQRGRAVEE